MRVLMISRATLFTHPGGDTIQIVKTAEYLNKIKNVRVDIKTVSDKINVCDYDFLHLFNIMRPSDIMGIIEKSKLPYVISTIFVDYSETEANHPKINRRILSKVFSTDQLEYIKTIARAIKGQEKITDYRYLLLGQKNSIKRIIKNARALLPNSLSEYKRLYKSYGIEQEYKVIPNAIDINIFNNNFEAKNEFDKFKGAVICVGQFTPVKNQLNIIKALSGTKYRVYFIGNPSSNAIKYYKKCKEEASKNIHFIPFAKQEDLAQIYNMAKVHVLASWFETTGLVSLESAYMGCNIVITNKGDQVEYFMDDAFYCKPGEPKSILDAVNKAYNSSFNKELKQRIGANYTWTKTAHKTHQLYQKAI